MRKILALLVMCFCLNGCMTALTAAALVHQKRKAAYQEYKTNAIQINRDREKAGLEPNPIPTFNEWKKQ